MVNTSVVLFLFYLPKLEVLMISKTFYDWLP
jgi:hypothetical protein